MECNLWSLKYNNYEWLNGVILMENKQISQKQGTCHNFCGFIMKISIDLFVNKYFKNIVKIILLKIHHDLIHDYLQYKLLYFCIYLVFGGLKIAVPMSHDRIKFISIKYNTLS